MRSMRLTDITAFLSGGVVLGFGLFLIGLAVLVAARPSLAERFLSSFASSAQAHYSEQLGRLTVGAAMTHFAHFMWFPYVFKLFGWVLVISAIGLLVIPWQWHHAFATKVMPPVIRHMRLFALSASALGAFILYGMSRAAGS